MLGALSNGRAISRLKLPEFRKIKLTPAGSLLVTRKQDEITEKKVM